MTSSVLFFGRAYASNNGGHGGAVMKAGQTYWLAGALVLMAGLSGCGLASGEESTAASTVYVVAPADTSSTAVSTAATGPAAPSKRPHRHHPRATATVTVAPPQPTQTVVVTYAPAPEPSSYDPSPAWPGVSLSTKYLSYYRTDVARVQAQLVDYGYGPMPVDGHYGPVTESAVRRFQINHDLIVDGVVGPQTWSFLF